MNLKTAIMIGTAGAALRILVSVAPLLGETIRDLMWSGPGVAMGTIFYLLGDIAIFTFFITLHTKQK